MRRRKISPAAWSSWWSKTTHSILCTLEARRHRATIARARFQFVSACAFMRERSHPEALVWSIFEWRSAQGVQ